MRGTKTVGQLGLQQISLTRSVILSITSGLPLQNPKTYCPKPANFKQPQLRSPVLECPGVVRQSPTWARTAQPCMKELCQWGRVIANRSCTALSFLSVSNQYPLDKCSMYGIFTYIYNKLKPNVDKYMVNIPNMEHLGYPIHDFQLATKMLLDYEIASTTLGHHWDTDFWSHWDREITEILTYTPSFLYLKPTYTMTKIIIDHLSILHH